MIDKQRLLQRAMSNETLMDGTTALVKDIIDDAELVFAVWRDVDQPDGIGVIVLKGAQLLRTITASGQSVAATWDAVLCENAEHAEAARRILGERDKRHRPRNVQTRAAGGTLARLLR